MTALSWIVTGTALAAVLALGLHAQPLILPPPPAPRPLERAVVVSRMVEALRLKEAWDGRSTGAAGEWGPWQFKPAVWRQYSKLAMHGASVSQHRAVATEHVIWILGELLALGLPRTPESVALVHNAGYGTVKAGRISARQRKYAIEAANLYGTL